MFSVTVSNAGMGLIGPIECQSLDEMTTVMDTNFFGLVRLLKEILPDMKKRKKGHIVVISSVMGIQGECHECRSVTLATVILHLAAVLFILALAVIMLISTLSYNFGCFSISIHFLILVTVLLI